MARKDSGNYARKHAPDRKADPAVADAVNQRTKDGEIGCATAFEIAAEHGVRDCLSIDSRIPIRTVTANRRRLGRIGHLAFRLRGLDEASCLRQGLLELFAVGLGTGHGQSFVTVAEHDDAVRRRAALGGD